MAEHFKIPGAVPLHQFVSKVGLQELHRICYLASFEGSPLFDEIQKQIPDDADGSRAERTKAIYELLVIAQKSLKMKG